MMLVVAPVKNIPPPFNYDEQLVKVEEVIDIIEEVETEA